MTASPSSVARHRHRPHRGRRVLDDEDEIARLSDLNCDGGDSDGLLDAQRQLRVHQRAGPQHLVLVFDGRAQSRPCRSPSPPCSRSWSTDRSRAAARPAPGHRPSHSLPSMASRTSGSTFLRHPERHVDRRDLIDGRKRHDVARPHEVADLDGRRADAPGDRRADRGVVELHPEVLERRLVSRDIRARGVGRRLGVVRDWSPGWRSSRPARSSA